MASLTGKKIKNTYKDLLQVSNSNSGVDSTLRTVSDGEATDSALSISTVAVAIDNLKFAGNAITSTDTAGDITITPDTTGDLILDGLKWPQADGSSGQAIVTDAAGQLSFSSIAISELGDISDVTITSIASGELLKWNGSAWINNTLAEAGVAAASHTHTSSEITDLATSTVTFSNKSISFGTNTVTMTKAQLDTAITDGNAAYDGGAHHDGFSDFVANEHIDHSAVTLTAGEGLSGGGTIESNRTFTLDLNELTTDTAIASGDLVAFTDITDNGNQNITFSNFEAALNLTNQLGTLPVSQGGTGATSLTDGGILLGSGTGAVTALGVATNGQIPIGDGATDPVLATLTEGAGIDITNGAGSITIAGETASTTNAGIVELATAAEVSTGTDTGRAVTPVSLPIQIQDSKYTFAADAEASDTYAISLTPAPAAYATGQVFYFTANTANTGAATLNVNSLGAKAILKLHDTVLANGDIEAGAIVQVAYDGTQFQMLSQIGNAAAGSGDMVLADVQTVTGAKTFGSAGAVGKLIVAGTTSGTTIIDATAVAGSTTVTLPAATDTLVGKATTDTLTNKTFDANGTGNSLSNVDVADLANGTDGELITWDAAGAPATVAVGTSGHVLTSGGTGVAPTFQAPSGGGDWVLIESQTASTSAQLQFTTMSTDYRVFCFMLNAIRPATDGAILEFRTSSDGGCTFDSGASDYQWGLYEVWGGGSGSASDTSDAQIDLTKTIGNLTTEAVSGQVWVYSPQDALYTRMTYATTSRASDSNLTSVFGGGARLSAADVDGVQFEMSSGNITSGTIACYGLSLA